MKALLIYIFLFLVMASFGQNENPLFYKNQKGDIISQANFNNYVANLKQKFEGKPFVVKVAIDTTVTTNDSVINSYRIIISSKGMENMVPKEQTVDYSQIDLSKIILHTLDGKTLSFNDLKGKPIVLNFWHTKCMPCIWEMPALDKIKEDYGDKVHFVSVTNDSKELVREFFETHSFSFTKIIEANELTELLSVNVYPRLFYIDKNGKIKKSGRGVGMTKNSEGKMVADLDSHIREEIEKLIKK